MLALCFDRNAATMSIVSSVISCRHHCICLRK
ncbi:unnamed protein product [Spirodela intermedia]|uniref:Uncharacterized protein n=1 Tax=Spirodela intermedia TaxID=51605 RepID=A0A7I8KF23_SPIIN|nr:unnamed protein product [Spirodela intermedia]